ncbi:hypothetical protein DYI42_05790 [Vannielia litorea]|nr:hypothetical protein [Vannielia litorea]
MAPISYSLCSDCTTRGAENIGFVSFWRATYGGADAAPGFQADPVAWVDASYVGWPQIRAHHIRNEDEILSSFAEEFSLGDDPYFGP